MCLLVLAWMSHPRYRLVVAANRDEFHDRPAAPLAWWDDESGVLAGRDLAAGGTWMGLTRSGRFGAVTNFRDLEHTSAPDAPSRGTLVPAYLAGDDEPAVFMSALGASAARFAGFNLLVGGLRGLYYVSNRSDEPARELSPGIYGLSNHTLDSPWPKLLRSRARFAAELERADPDSASLFELLADRDPAVDPASIAASLPTEWERALSAPFVTHPRFGTRCSTVLLAARDGLTVVMERRFDASGRQTGATRIEFDGDEPRE
jgi:uncharacterized protein with NRDE domain